MRALGSFGLGLLTVNAVEWAAHKYLLHGLGKKKDSIFRFHWGEHHNACRKNDFYDADYEKSPWARTSQGKELSLLFGAVVAVAPTALASPYFYAGLVAGTGAYYYLHKRAHLHPEWAKKWMPWHVEHHMGRDQDANWCVTWPGFDYVMGTRVKSDASRAAPNLKIVR